MSRSYPISPILLVFSASILLAAPIPGHAQEHGGVRWSPNYRTARREAQEANKPLLVDFGIDPQRCFWCGKLDTTTFRDPTIVRLLNDHFVAVKVDAEVERELAQALRIDSYPTIVLASSGGRVLQVLPGYKNPTQLQEILQHVLASQPRAEPVARRNPEPKPVVPEPSMVAEGPKIEWRTEYNRARQEAQEKNRPLLLEFCQETNPLCQKMDATTLRDPNVVQTLNDQFIPLRVEVDKEMPLAQALRVQTYPTIVMAAPDGRILGTFEGYLEANRFNEYLQRTLSSITNPEWMTRDYQAAAKAIANSDYAQAIALLKSITEDGNDRPIQLKAKQLLQDLEQQAAGRLTRAKQLSDKGQTAEAMEKLTELLRQFTGTQAAVDAAQMLTALGNDPSIKDTQRKQRARELLAQAREDYRTQQYLWCLQRCEVLATSYADLSEGSEAAQLAGEIKNNPEWMQRACDQLSERLSDMYLAQAETWLKKGQPQQAVLCLERVVQTFPGSRHAQAAQIRMSQIQGRPTQQADFQQP